MAVNFIFTRASIQFRYDNEVNLELPYGPQDGFSQNESSGFANLSGTPLWPWVNGGQAITTVFARNTWLNGVHVGAGVDGYGIPFSLPLFYGWQPDWRAFPSFSNDVGFGRRMFQFFAFGQLGQTGPLGDPAFALGDLSFMYIKSRIHPFRANVWCNNIRINIPPVDGVPDWSGLQTLAMAFGSALAVCQKI